MSIDRNRRTTFEEMADIYNEVRTGYPPELVEDVLSLSGIPARGRILEIGCGPGNATVDFARRGYRVLAIELGQRLAAFAVENCRAYPHVAIVNTAFEDWPVEEQAFDLAIAADSFHWIPPETGYPKVARALKPSGSAAFFWQAPVEHKTDWMQAIAEEYACRGLQADNPETRFTVGWMIEVVTQAFQESGCFAELTVRKYESIKPVTGENYIKSLRTYSGHREMKADIREDLYAGIHVVIEGFGGKVDQPRLVVLFHARVKDAFK
jgi:SAM-dependent methyltransferase